MNFRQFMLVVLGATAVAFIMQCGSSSPTVQPTPTPTTTTPTTTLPSGGLPAGMVCSPTPPPLYGMKVTIFTYNPDRILLDSKPLVMNVDNYCDRVGIGSGQYCDTRPEGDPQRVACDYLATGISNTGRWGPSWYYNGVPCVAAGQDGSCANNIGNQFMAVAKDPGEYAACVAPTIPIAAGGNSCGTCTVVKGKKFCQ